MSFISILAPPRSAYSVRANAKALNRMVRCIAVAGFLIGGPRLFSAPSTGSERTAQRMNDEGAPARAGRALINEPQYSRVSPGLRNARPSRRLTVGPSVGSSAVAWSGEL